jgi:DNA-binding NarL/FixJ family response regulator
VLIRASVRHVWDPMQASSEPIRVVVADDHSSYRIALDAVLSADSRLEVVGSAADGRRALELIGEQRPDVALVDLMMTPVDGFEVCEALRSGRVPEDTSVILISAYEDPELVARGRSCGAAGYLSKDASNEALCSAVLAVAAGGTCFDAT